MRLSKWAPAALGLLRIVSALLFVGAGMQKIFGFPIPGPQMTPVLWVQGTFEIIGGLLLLIGLQTRLVAFVLSGDMAVAYFMAHFPRSFFPAANGGSAAILYCFVFLYFVFAGAGLWSVDEGGARSQ
jgi:putative oxidoreductase